MIINHNVSSDIFKTLQSSLDPIVNKQDINFHFLEISFLDLKTRILLRKISNETDGENIIIISKLDSVATFAYKIGAFHFLKSDLTSSHLSMLKYKIAHHKNNSFGDNLIFKSKNDGILIASIKNIAFFTGKGDYCDFRFLDGSTYLDSHRISEIVLKINGHPDLFRLNKSVVINVNKVSKIMGNIIYFSNSTVRLQLSTKAISELKKRLLWLNE